MKLYYTTSAAKGHSNGYYGGYVWSQKPRERVEQWGTVWEADGRAIQINYEMSLLIHQAIRQEMGPLLDLNLIYEITLSVSPAQEPSKSLPEPTEPAKVPEDRVKEEDGLEDVSARFKLIELE